MDSRIFIRNATDLIEDIKTFSQNDYSTGGDIGGSALQKEINAAFASLQNPTLNTAEVLMNTALEAGFSVAPQVQQRIRQAMSVWPQV
jgi:hypothetical protein